MNIGNIDLSFKEAENILLWQYSNAPRLYAIIQNEKSFFDKNIDGFWVDFYNDVFNLQTANSFGLNVWGSILGVGRLTVSPKNMIVDTAGILRFYNVDTMKWHSIWLSGNISDINIETNPPDVVPASVTQLDDETYRKCLLAKIYLLTSNVSIREINRYLYVLFDGKEVYIRDNFDMTMTVIFKYNPNDVELSIITNPNFSPRPMGVEMNYGIDLNSTSKFGFENTNLKTFIPTEQPNSLEGYGSFYNIR